MGLWCGMREPPVRKTGGSGLLICYVLIHYEPAPRAGFGGKIVGRSHNSESGLRLRFGGGSTRPAWQGTAAMEL